MSNELPCAYKNCTDPNHHGGDSVVELEHPVVDGDLVRLNQGRDGLCEGCDEQECHALFKLSSIVWFFLISQPSS